MAASATGGASAFFEEQPASSTQVAMRILARRMNIWGLYFVTVGTAYRGLTCRARPFTPPEHRARESGSARITENNPMGTPQCPEELIIESFSGQRQELLPFFSEADDSPAEIASYIELGEVLVARFVDRLVGHVQLIANGSDWEIRSVAVIESARGNGVGKSLLRAAIERAFSKGASRILVATATADIGNLRFYQRLGFRMDRVERDALTAARGYLDLQVDGIPVRDRVWFSMTQRPALV